MRVLRDNRYRTRHGEGLTSYFVGPGHTTFSNQITGSRDYSSLRSVHLVPSPTGTELVFKVGGTGVVGTGH